MGWLLCSKEEKSDVVFFISFDFALKDDTLILSCISKLYTLDCLTWILYTPFVCYCQLLYVDATLVGQGTSVFTTKNII